LPALCHPTEFGIGNITKPAGEKLLYSISFGAVLTGNGFVLNTDNSVVDSQIKLSPDY
jgi:hypothetical protein